MAVMILTHSVFSMGLCPPCHDGTAPLRPDAYRRALRVTLAALNGVSFRCLGAHLLLLFGCALQACFPGLAEPDGDSLLPRLDHRSLFGSRMHLTLLEGVHSALHVLLH